MEMLDISDSSLKPVQVIGFFFHFSYAYATRMANTDSFKGQERI